MADVLLIVPPFSFASLNTNGDGRRGGFYLYYPPLGLCSIGACLRADGFGVRIVDCRIERVDRKRILSIIDTEQPAVIGMMVTTPTLPVCHRWFKMFSERRDAGKTGAVLVAGGPHVSCDPEIIRELGADYGIAGDGEPGMAALARHVARGEGGLDAVPGLVRADNGNLLANPTATVESVANAPFPDRSLLRENLYFNPYFPARTTTILSARGCPFKCTFCSRSESMGAYRPLPVEEFLEEAAEIGRRGYGFASLIDETFTHDRDRAAAVAEGLLKGNTRFRWSCQTRADAVDREIIALIKRAGCVNISFGVETGGGEARRNLEKEITNEQCRSALELCREAGISTNAFFIIGGPDDTERDLAETIDFAVALEPDYAVFNIGTLFPGSRFFEQECNSGRASREIWDRYMRGETPLPVLSRALGRDTLAAYLSRGYRRFYLRPRYLARYLPKLRSPRRFAYMLRLAKTVVTDYAGI